MAIVSAKRHHGNGFIIRIISDDGVVSDCTENNLLIHDFLAAGGVIEDADPVDYSEEVRGERNRRLRESDWTQLPDTRLAPGEVAAWVQYRNNLRDMVIDPDTPSINVVWPTVPGA